MPILEKGKMKPIVEKELRNIEKLDEEMHSSRRSLKALSKKQRKRFLASLDLSEATEDNIDDIIRNQLENSTFNKAKKVKTNPKSIIDDWLEEDLTPADEQEKPVLLFQEKSSKIKKSKKKRMLLEADVPSKKAKLEKSLNESSSKKVKSKELFNADSEWDTPLKEGETEFFVPSKKIVMRNANEALKKENLLVPNPFAKTKAMDSPKTPKNQLKGKSLKFSTPLSTPGKKKVTIALKQNASQSVAEHIKQVRSSPLNPHDASKNPIKGLLKPNSMPGPINPYYKKKLKLNLNDTI